MRKNKEDVQTDFMQTGAKSLFSISFPLMVSSLATLFMIFVDRLFLASYSTDTLNAAVNSGTLAWAFFGGFGMLTSMSEIFVAQYNGSGQKQMIGKSVWQMIWVSFFSILFFLPMAIWVAPILYQDSIYATLQTQYFSILLLFAPGYVLMCALSGFFIGQGKTALLIILAILANLVNIVLDKMFIFGVKGFIPEMGIKGAAIATCTGYLLQAIILLILFLRQSNKDVFKTNYWRLDKELFVRGIKVGAPQGIFYFLEIFGWALFYEMMTRVSEMHITVSSICQSIIILLSFFMEGLSKGVSAIAGNFIGAKKPEKTTKILQSGIKLQCLFSFFTIFLFVLDPKITLPFFLNGLDKSIFASNEFFQALQTSLLFVFLYLTFEGIKWVIAGLLTAAGDTLFLLIAGTTSVWIFLLLPIYVLVLKMHNPIELAWILAFIYSVITCSIYYFRFYKGKWKEICLISPIMEEKENLTNDERDRIA